MRCCNLSEAIFSMSLNPSVERVKPVSIISILLLMTVITFLAVIAYFIFFPKAVSFNVRPAGASVYANGKSVCASTPCRISMNRVFPKHIVIHKERRKSACFIGTSFPLKSAYKRAF